MEYERKLNDMNREMKRLQQTQREHIRQQKELKTQEVKLQNLRMELNELKCSKVCIVSCIVILFVIGMSLNTLHKSSKQNKMSISILCFFFCCHCSGKSLFNCLINDIILT